MSYLKELRKLVGHRPLLSAGATVLVIQDQKVLLNLRADTHTWGIPGGGMELEESLEDTARRELAEETGLCAQELRLLTVFSGQDFYFEYPNGDKLYSIVAETPLLSFGFPVKTAHADQFAACLFNEPEIIRCARIIVDALQPFERVGCRFVPLIAHIPRYSLVAGTCEYGWGVCRSQRAQD